MDVNNNLDEIAEDFHYLIFIPNAIKRNVKVIDDSDMTSIFKVDKFVKIIERLVDYHTSIVVRNCCADYGGSFLLDRNNKRIKRLDSQVIDTGLNFSELENELKHRGQKRDVDDVMQVYKNILKVTASEMQNYGAKAR